MGINNVPAGWSSTFAKMLPRDTDNTNSNHNTNGLCVNFRGVDDCKSRQLKPTAQLTAELKGSHRIDTSIGQSGTMVVWEELRARYGFASVFGLQCIFCLFFQWISV
jgi:hypothetical protein